MNGERADHWEKVYRTKSEMEVSWFEDEPRISLDLIRAAELPPDAPIIDVGGGESRLVDRLLALGHSDLSVLDISAKALDVAKARIGAAASRVDWIVADITQWKPARQWRLWHDRAVFHFLTDSDDRRKYVAALQRALSPEGHVIIGTFALDGPAKCSGLDVARYDARAIAAELGAGFQLREQRDETHVTPWNTEQRFSFFRFGRVTR
jgi:SAM-dependent methyltransferase